MASHGGGIIQLGPFKYTVSGTLSLVTTVTLQGIPGATKIVKTTGDGPVVRVFGGARLKDCTIELNRSDGTTYTADQNPTNPWENSVVHLCEPVFEDKYFIKDSSSVYDSGWDATMYGAATIEGCMINTRISATRGIYIYPYGVESNYSSSGLTLDDRHLNSRVINNTIIPADGRVSGVVEHSCIYYHNLGTATGAASICLGNICTSGALPSGEVGVITTPDAASSVRSMALGRSSAGANAPREECNIATYTEY